MKEFLNIILKHMIGEDKYRIEEADKKYEIKYLVYVNQEKMGRVIGRGGDTAKAIRTIVRSLNDTDKKVFVEFIENEK